jgi:quinol monooxygenase YgiN
MILATIRMTIPPKKHDDALKILRSIAAKCKVCSGCLGCYIYEDAQDDEVIMYEEMWESEKGLDRHLRSQEYQNLLLVMEMALKHPEVRFNTISTSEGMEMIERARGFAR